MKLTREKLISLGVCSDGLTWFNNQSVCDLEKIVSELILQNRFNWANWVISRVLSRKGRIMYAIFAAEQVLEIYERAENGNAPRLAIEAAKKVLRRNTAENRSAANAAADAAAYAAANAANAAYAANAAAYAAAYAAAHAADAANAANAAAHAAYAGLNIKIRIIKYGLNIIYRKTKHG